jgi:drug/metabolite transporter (DMT)-like permease
LSRLRADLLLLLAGLIWGFGFVAQKDAFSYVGPFTFVACRFLISALFVLPFARHEGGLRSFSAALKPGDIQKIIALCAAFIGAVILQQVGLRSTTVTNAAFITGIYIVLVPFAAWILYRQKLSLPILAASSLSFVGVWLLTGADLHNFGSGIQRGDGFILLCAVGYALQVAMMGRVVGALKLPCILSLLQYLLTGFVAFILAACFETIDWNAIAAAWLPILYAGVASGGIAYTLQAIAQQHTPSADSAIIMGSESLFGAVGGAWLLHEKLALSGYIGCAAIMISILLVELIPLLQTRRTSP